MNRLLVKISKEYLKEYAIFLASLVGALSLYATSDSLLQYMPQLIPPFLSRQSIHLLLRGNQFFIGLVSIGFTLFVYPIFLKSQKKDLEILLLLGENKRTIQKAFSYQLGIFLLVGVVISVFISGISGKFLGQLLVFLMKIQVVIPFLYTLKTTQNLILLGFFLWLFLSFELFFYINKLTFRTDEISSFNENKILNPVGSFLTILLGLNFFITFFNASKVLIFLRQLSFWHYDITWWFLGSFLGSIASVFGFYFYLLPYFSKVSPKKMWIYYQKKYFFLWSYLKAFLAKAAFTYASLTILAACSFTLIGMGYLFTNLVKEESEGLQTVDFQVGGESEEDLLKLIKKNHLTLEKKVTTPYKVEVAQFPFRFSTQDDWQKREEVVNLISISEYKKLLTFQNSQDDFFKLEQGEGLYLKKRSSLFSDYLLEAPFLTIGNQKLDLKEVETTILAPEDIRYQLTTVVVTDAFFAELKGENYQIATLKLDKRNLSKEEERRAQEAITKEFTPNWLQGLHFIQDQKGKGTLIPVENQNFKGETFSRMNIKNVYNIKKSQQMITGLLLFLALFTGFIFLLTTGSLLMIHQLQLAKKNQPTYRLYLLMGVDEKDLKKQVRQELKWIFSIPLMMGFFISTSLLSFFNQLFPIHGKMTSYLFVMFILLGFYYVFYVVTNYHYYRWLKK